MARRELIPPPARCEAQAKRTGQRCRRHAVVGSKVCSKHGAYAGRNGRARAEDLHRARVIESAVTDFASKAMLAAGFPAGVVEMAGGRLPRVDPDEESQPAEINEEAVVDHSTARLAQSLTRQLQGAAVELAGAQAQAAASRPETLEGELADPEPANGAQEPAEPDPVLDEVGERIAALDHRPTPGRMAEAARLRRPRERDQTPGERSEPDPPHVEPEPEPIPEVEPERNPRRDRAGRILAPPLGLGSGTPPAGSYRDFH